MQKFAEGRKAKLLRGPTGFFNKVEINLILEEGL